MHRKRAGGLGSIGSIQPPRSGKRSSTRSRQPAASFAPNGTRWVCARDAATSRSRIEAGLIHRRSIQVKTRFRQLMCRDRTCYRSNAAWPVRSLSAGPLEVGDSNDADHWKLPDPDHDERNRLSEAIDQAPAAVRRPIERDPTAVVLAGETVPKIGEHKLPHVLRGSETATQHDCVVAGNAIDDHTLWGIGDDWRKLQDLDLFRARPPPFGRETMPFEADRLDRVARHKHPDALETAIARLVDHRELPDRPGRIRARLNRPV